MGTSVLRDPLAQQEITSLIQQMTGPPPLIEQSGVGPSPAPLYGEIG